MATRVKDLADLTELFIQDTTPAKGDKMSTKHGTLKKKTPDKLNKIITSIWDYQQKHDGATPNQQYIATAADIKYSNLFYFMNMLIDAGRLNRISSQPYRATITDHPDNKKAIDAFKRLAAMREQFEENERRLIRERQERDATADQIERDKQAVNEMAAQPDSDLVGAVTPAATTTVPGIPTRMRPDVDAANEAVIERAVASADTARRSLRDNNRVLKAAMPQLVKLAETRDLLAELIERGYAVSKK